MQMCELSEKETKEMKLANANELHTVEGGYRLACSKCGAKSGSVRMTGLTKFFAAHKHGKRGAFETYAMYDVRNYRCAANWWS